MLAAGLLLPVGVGAQAAEVLQHSVGERAWLLEPAENGEALLKSGDTLLSLRPGESSVFSALIAEGDHWMVAGSRPTLTRSQDLFVLTGDRTTKREIAVPPAMTREERASPALLVRDVGGRRPLELEGLAWLQGSRPRSYSVWVSEWNGSELLQPVAVSQRGPGSQVALEGAVLADGSALLVWTAFDGMDDEVMWSRRVEGLWTAPALVSRDNSVPDIAPALVAHDGGALLAWSRYDGRSYRLVGSMLRDGAWSSVRPLGGPGSLYPTFVTANGKAMLIFLEALPRSWTLLELGTGLEPMRKASISTSRSERPTVVSLDPVGVRFSWVKSDASSLAGSRAAGQTVTQLSAPWRVAEPVPALPED